MNIIGILIFIIVIAVIIKIFLSVNDYRDKKEEELQKLQNKQKINLIKSHVVHWAKENKYIKQYVLDIEEGGFYPHREFDKDQIQKTNRLVDRVIREMGSSISIDLSVEECIKKLKIEFSKPETTKEEERNKKIKKNQEDEQKWNSLPPSEKSNLNKLLTILNLESVSSLFELNQLNVSEGEEIDSFIGYNNLQLLSSINIRKSKIKRLNGIEGMKNLKYVHLTNNSKLKDISAISQCKNVELIQLQECPIETLEPLFPLRKLTSISLSNNKIKDYSILSKFKLTFLSIENSNLKNIDFLASITTLVSLHLENLNLKDISALKHLKKLNTLSLNNNYNLNDIMPLSDLKNLESLYLNNTNVGNIDALHNLPLKWLEIRNVKINSLAPLKGKSRLYLNFEYSGWLRLRNLFVDKVALNHDHGRQSYTIR